MAAEDSVAAVRIHHQWMPDRLGAEKGIDPTTIESLKRRGHLLWTRTLPFGAAVQAVEVVETDGVRQIRAASDPRKGGAAAAY